MMPNDVGPSAQQPFRSENDEEMVLEGFCLGAPQLPPDPDNGGDNVTSIPAAASSGCADDKALAHAEPVSTARFDVEPGTSPDELVPGGPKVTTPSGDVMYGQSASTASQLSALSNVSTPGTSREGPTDVLGGGDRPVSVGRNRHFPVIGILFLVLGIAAVLVAVLGTKTKEKSPINVVINAPPADELLTPSPAPEGGSATLAKILGKGQLRIGITAQPGYASFNSLNGELEGFEVDLGRAVGAGVFGEDGHVDFKLLQFSERFEALQNGTVDLLVAAVTVTMERDIYEPVTQKGYTFSAPYLYNGLSFAGLPPYGKCADDKMTTGNCTDMVICVLADTTHVDLVTDLMPDASIVDSSSIESMYGDLSAGRCNAVAGEQFDVARATAIASLYSGDYEVGNNVYSKEPLAMTTRDGDQVWSDFVNWILQAILEAEAQKDEESEMKSVSYFGQQFETMFTDAIALVGNYGEMYARNLERIVPRQAINWINHGSSGLVYSLPFGLVYTGDVGPGPIPGSTLSTIRERGYLKCGIARAVGFGVIDITTGKWTGLDVDFCKAVSAAIFDGPETSIDYQVVSAADRFQALATGQVDLLSRISTWTLERDVLEPVSGVGFSFSQPTFYDGMAFGGIPPYGQCASNRDVTSAECVDLLICIEDGTTMMDVAGNLFPPDHIVPIQSNEESKLMVENGSCNALFHDLSQVNVEILGYNGPYEKAGTPFKEPLAVVTREDDQEFTSFVNWIVSATFFAEEEGITQSTAQQRLPYVDYFGPNLRRMLINAVEVVGNYGDVYERNLKTIVPREGMNLVNENPHGPQHYAMPGLF